MWQRCLAFLLLALVSRAEEVALTRVGDPWSYHPGFSTTAGHERDWQMPSFDDSSWDRGPSGFSAGVMPSEATVLSAPPTNSASVFFRHSWLLPDPSQVKWLTLRVDYTDGFVAYLNGTEIARRNLAGAPGTLVPFSTLAANLHDRAEFETMNVTDWRSALLPGTNVLAVQVHRAGTTSRDLCFSAELMANFTRAPYIQNTSSNHLQVIWNTPIPSTTRIDFGPTPALGTTIEDSRLVTTHVTMLSGLSPDTIYYYQVSSTGSDGQTVRSAVASSRTFRTVGPLSFIAFGDAGWNSPAQYALAEVVRQAAPDFVIEVGDIVYPSFTQELVDPRCFSPYQPQMASTPFFFALGNHDLDYGGVTNYLEAFYLPTNSVPAQLHTIYGTSPEHYYSFDEGDAHIVVLFQPYLSQYQLTAGDAQYTWLTNDLASTEQPWKIVCWHVPMFSSSQHRYDDVNFNGVYDRLEIQDVLLPVLSRYGVQLALCGHEHGYERFSPTNGVTSITTAGGGVELYTFTGLDEASAYYSARYNCVQVRIQGDTLHAQALGTNGAVFDEMVIQRRLPQRKLHQASWHSPADFASPGTPPAAPFDFVGEPIPSLSGQFSNLGRVYVNNDASQLYIGLEEVMIHNDNNVFVFVESPHRAGTADLLQTGNGIVDPLGQGADGLDCLSNLSFRGFWPAVACILGDPLANTQLRNFGRRSLGLNIGQGVFNLDAQLTDVSGVRIRQFNSAPPMGNFPGEPNASFIEIAIPLDKLGGLTPGESIRLGGVVGGAEYDPNAQTRFLDSGFLGEAMDGSGSSGVVLQGLQVQLAFDPRDDSDGDGLPDAWEIAHGLNPHSAVGADGRDGDPDSDGATNIEEFLAGTDPRDRDSALGLQSRRLPDGSIRLSWLALPGHHYELQEFDFSTTVFQTLERYSISAGQPAADQSYDIDPKANRKPAQYFRLQLDP